MPFLPRLFLAAALVTSFLGAASLAADDHAKLAPTGLTAPGSDRSVIYKFDPLSKKFTAVARKDLKAQHVYHRWSPTLGRWVWSKVGADGTLRFAFGPGSSQPAALFDMPATPARVWAAIQSARAGQPAALAVPQR